MAYFSYEHFYVIYCKFWELDRDHDLFIDQHDLARHNDHGMAFCLSILKMRPKFIDISLTVYHIIHLLICFLFFISVLFSMYDTCRTCSSIVAHHRANIFGMRNQSDQKRQTEQRKPENVLHRIRVVPVVRGGQNQSNGR